MNTIFSVMEGDVTEVKSDLLLLKYAQSFYGADEAVAKKLIDSGKYNKKDLQPRPGSYVCVDSRGIIAPKNVIFLGTPPLSKFGYGEMILFARDAIGKIDELGLSVKTMTTTVHGSGYGLDSGESLQSLIIGFMEGFSAHKTVSIEDVTFLTLGKRTILILRSILERMGFQNRSVSYKPDVLDDLRDRKTITEKSIKELDIGIPEKITLKPNESGLEPAIQKKKAFVAMPFDNKFLNVYDFGIYPAVRKCNMICERVDEVKFIGDILGRIRSGIEEADLVIADLTDGRPNVYLEVGYAWGLGIPVIFIALEGEKLHFDVSTHKCIYYGRFLKLEEDLMNLIKGLNLK